MLSILIPIYNENVIELVQTLQHQCKEQHLIYEILCIDDCSTEEIKKQNEIGLAKLNVSYLQLHKNIGRSRIRNKLIDASKYDVLLFIDSDHKIISKDYIGNYIKLFSDPSYSAIYGGTVYPDKSKIQPEHILHWEYGISREVIPAKKRSLHPAEHLHTNNLLIRKGHLDEIRFDESIVGYGYEDIVFGQDLFNVGKVIRHIDNPLMHLGLKSESAFHNDLKNASNNLAYLYTRSKIKGLKITRVFGFLKGTFLIYPIISLLSYSEPLLLNTLKKRPQYLYIADVLRLLYFVQAVQIHHKS